MKEQLQLHREKIDQARAYMRERNVDLWLIRDRGTGDPSVPLLFGTPTRGDTIYLITAERLEVVVEERDRDIVADSGLFDEVEVRTDDGLAATLARRVHAVDPGSIALNISSANHLADGLTMGSYRSLLRMLGEPYSTRVVSSEEYIQRLRSIKSDQEIAYIKRAIEITLDIYSEVFAQVRPGMTEIEVGDLFVAGMRSRGVLNGITRQLSPPIVMKHKIAHRPPGEGVLERGDYVIVDFSVDYMGYCSDIARTAYVLKEGETVASEPMQKAFRTVREATDLAVAALKPGAIGKDVDHVARQYVLDHGYPNIFHSVGHQVGRDVHDGGTILGPEKQGYRKAVLGTVEEGMVFAIEPTILYEEGPAIISEDNYVVTAGGAELLGEPQRELVLIR
jgi:Xaa-Pro aminopeptidase